MSSKKQKLESGAVQEQTNLGTAAPVGDQIGAIPLDGGHVGNMRPTSYLITVVVEGGASDLLMYGRVGGEWGLHSGRYGAPSQKIGVALAVGTHHIVVEDVGLYDELFFAKSANTVSSVKIRPILFSNYGS